ncbi:RagB/SusD family nutrient uptake outer membrane protein [Pedobacter panaciterrae]
MKIFNKTYVLMSLFVCVLYLYGCKQSDWLDEKRIKSDVRPETLKDYQAILDNVAWINNRFVSSGLACADNIYVTERDFGSLQQGERQLYLWGNDPWAANGNTTPEWSFPYTIIEYANIVLDGLAESNSDSPEVKNIKGQALFYRSMALYNLTQLFCRQYDAGSATREKGLPIRLTSDVNIIVQRSSLAETFSQITLDCKDAIANLNMTQSFFTRPSKLAAYGLLAKIYLNMGIYDQALENANQVLNQYSSLLDFNGGKVSLAKTYRFPANGQGNEEILFYAYGGNMNIIRPTTNTRGNVDSILYRMYSDNDLRKVFFYNKSTTAVKFRGGYTGNFYTFNGIATNEIYLIKSECAARLGQIDAAMNTLNTLLRNRYITGTYIDQTAEDIPSALRLILAERRKELPFTLNTRWEDLKRLNKEEGQRTTLRRVIAGTEYILNPGDPRYSLPIPISEINLSGIEQNDY